MITGLVILAAAGLGLAAGAWVLMALKLLFPADRRVRLKEIKGNSRPGRPRDPRSTRETAAVLAGMVGMLLLGWGSRPQVLVFLVAVGGAVGLLITRMLGKFKEGGERASTIRELTVFFEAVELYLRAGCNLPQAMRASALLTPRLRKAVSDCLACWPAGSKRALEVLRRNLGPEAEILVSLLGQVDRVGLKNLEGVMQREAYNLERLRQLAEEVNIVKRPLYFTLYRALPLAAVVGLIVGPLLYRVAGVLREAIFFF
ncbi:hypothetical protein Desku_2445 [Desulfofundulus kuznetsovii DSM 6115]|uniref:Type II secretion system protein GspF domain-containing protein n=1 Tax=Desulfofundulus kuznetsovii (strain DSM 6115 / VKM B-1805 / 17) TaxID=760568 RepID=A0AAU8PCZ2_DESK7|nr:hypothetical protein Desku_2445 [Desulfofundulus kuznetsovii DSM 6115]